jgi:hypothetical protein
MALRFTASHSYIDIRCDPSLSPWLCSASIERNTICSGISSGIEQQTPRVCVIVFPALSQHSFIAIRFERFRIGVFPATTPAVMSLL